MKSLIYLSCFVAAALVYHNMEQEDKFQSQLLSEELVDTEFEDDISSEELTEKILEEQD